MFSLKHVITYLMSEKTNFRSLLFTTSCDMFSPQTLKLFLLELTASTIISTISSSCFTSLFIQPDLQSIAKESYSMFSFTIFLQFSISSAVTKSVILLLLLYLFILSFLINFSVFFLTLRLNFKQGVTVLVRFSSFLLAIIATSCSLKVLGSLTGFSCVFSILQSSIGLT